MIRACILPNAEYEQIDKDIVKYCSDNFYKLYEQLFHARNCTYNTHTMCSHLDKIRVHGPLTFTSAFGFEAFYGEMRRAFVPGTKSPLKQILMNIMLKRVISFHSCKATIYFSPKDTNMECNSYIYTFNRNDYQFYKIVSIEENEFECNVVEKSEAMFQETPTLNWGKVGVFKYGEIKDEVEIVQRHNIAGKLIKVKDLLITCPINVLEEK